MAPDLFPPAPSLSSFVRVAAPAAAVAATASESSSSLSSSSHSRSRHAAAALVQLLKFSNDSGSGIPVFAWHGTRYEGQPHVRAWNNTKQLHALLGRETND